MHKFILSTDSTCDLYADFIRENDIKFVSLTYTVEKNGKMTDGLDAFQSYAEYVDFYKQLREGAFSRTSMLNYESHYTHFRKLAEEGAKDVLHFTISSGLSPTVTVANKAADDVKKDFPDFHLLAVDSLSATIGQGALVKEALRLRNAGATVQEAYDRVVELQKHIQYAIFANDLYYLKRGGRVSTVAAIAGSVLQVKPVLSFTREGKLVVVDKVRGMKKAFAWALEKQEKFPPVEENRMIWIVHTDAEEQANELAAMIESKWGFKPDVTIMGPVIGSHVGPGAVAVIWSSLSLLRRRKPKSCSRRP